jgi:adenylate kinase
MVWYRPLARLFAALSLVAALAAQSTDKSVVIVLIGPTGSGKTTQAEFLKRKYGLEAITADDLLKENPSALAKYETRGIDPGTPQTSPALNDLVRDRLSKMDVKKGFVLDGYPATKDHADHLTALVKEMGLPSPIILQLDVPDNVARKRLNKRGRQDDTQDLIERRLKGYHREMDMIRSYYPEDNIWTIDGTRSEREVSKKIQAILDGRIRNRS